MDSLQMKRTTILPALKVCPLSCIRFSFPGKYFAAQSLDNQILIYGARDRFRLNRKKVFKGHLNAGYACQVNFSPDGR